MRLRPLVVRRNAARRSAAASPVGGKPKEAKLDVLSIARREIERDQFLQCCPGVRRVFEALRLAFDLDRREFDHED
jgi:hypothetical protein